MFTRHVELRLGGLPLLAIDRICLEALQTELLQRYARRTVELTMSQTKSVLKAAYVTGRIGRDPTLGLAMPKVRAGQPDGRVRPEDVPTRAEVIAILEAAPARFRGAVALGVTGLRIGEVLAVSADRLDLERRRLLVDRATAAHRRRDRVHGPEGREGPDRGLARRRGPRTASALPRPPGRRGLVPRQPGQR